jgi:DNA-binding CsgD family transcriptional regulator
MAEPAVDLGGPVAARPGASGAAVALLVVDDDCRVSEASLAACRLLGLGRDDVIDHALPELLSPPAADRLRAVWAPFHETGGHAGPFELAWPNGAARLDISVTAAVLPGRHLVVLARSDNGDAAGRPIPGLAAPPRSTPAADGRLSRGPTARERQILGMLASGDTDVQIAAKLELSPATVQTHVRNAKAKLGARTRSQAVAMALRDGLIAD